MQAQIVELVAALLDEKEIAVAERLHFLIENEPEMWKAWALLEQILPVYWKTEGGFLYTLAPVFVYRTLYYLNHPHEYARNPRYMIFMMGNHLEGLLVKLLNLHNRPLGNLSHYLSKTKPTELSSSLLKFNEIYRRTKHMSGDPFLETRLDLKTFSTCDAVYCLFVTRNLSIKLFDLLRKAGNPLKEEWKPIDTEWFTWDREEPINPGRGGISKSEQPEM
jgi:hypothetical protein